MEDLEFLFTPGDIANMTHGRAHIPFGGESIQQHLLNNVFNRERGRVEYVDSFPAKGGYLGFDS